MSNIEKGEIKFLEEQSFRQWWIWLIISALVALAVWIFITQIINHTPFGQHPLPDFGVYIVVILFGIGLPLLFILMKMKTIIQGDVLTIRILVLLFKRIPLDDIREFSICEFSPMKDFGGWGIRWNPKMGLGYFVQGGLGIRLVLKNGRRIIIGSQEPERFADVLNSCLKTKN